MILNESPTIKRAVELYNRENRINKAVEECGELIAKLQQLNRDSSDFDRVNATEDEVRNEIADVLITMAQLREIFDPYLVDSALLLKLHRLNKILDKREEELNDESETQNII